MALPVAGGGSDGHDQQICDEKSNFGVDPPVSSSRDRPPGWGGGLKIPARNKAAGFIVSLEFLLVLVVVVFPLMLGMFLIGRKLVTLALTELNLIELPLSRPVVWDSTGAPNNKPVGAVIGYDQFQAPLVLYRDATGTGTPGVLLGVRPNRFTTVAEVYYDEDGCPEDGGASGRTYMRSDATSYLDSDFFSPVNKAAYGVGNGNVLWRRSSSAVTVVLESYWVSQDTNDESPASSATAAAPPSTACVDIVVPVDVILTGLNALSRVSGVGTRTATATYGTSGGGGTPLNHGLATGTYPGATITCDGFVPTDVNWTTTSPNCQSSPQYFGTFAITVDTGVSTTDFYWDVLAAGVNSDPSNPFPPGQLPNVEVTLPGAAGSADYLIANKVADLDDPATNFTRPFRMAFAKSQGGPGPVKTCPGGEGCP